MTERTKITDYLTRDELKAFSRRSDARGFFAIASTWLVIGLAFALLARFPHPITFVVAVIVIGGRQLALAILTHEAAHRSLFETRALNDVFTDLVCARPIWNDVARYREHHVRHHAHTNTAKDLAREPRSFRPLPRGLARRPPGLHGAARPPTPAYASWACSRRHRDA